MSGSRAKKILVRTVTGATIAGVVALIFWWAQRSDSSLPVAIVATALAFASSIELARMGSMKRYGLVRVLPLIALVSYALSADRSLWASRIEAFSGDGHGALAFHAFSIATGAALLRLLEPGSSTVRLRATIVSALCALWIIAPLSLLPEVWLRFGLNGTMAFVVLSKVGDITGYFVGNACGRHHPFPRLSPGKTTEGCLGSLVGAILVGGWLAHSGWIGGGLGQGFLAGMALNLAGQAGDLLESKVKRTTGVKDSSAWLGASGGFLDVLDSLFLTVPTALILWPQGF